MFSKSASGETATWIDLASEAFPRSAEDLLTDLPSPESSDLGLDQVIVEVI